MLAVLVAGFLVASGCGDPPMDPTPQLQISCPTSKSVESLTGDPVSVDYGVPTASGGAQPVTTSCNPSSRALFSVGTTNITCTARDTNQNIASCVLNVTVTRPGTLSATRFMAFGDSITFGPLLTVCSSASAQSLREWLQLDALFLRRLTTHDTPPATSYPSVLQGLLRSRYVTQLATIVNEGFGGERVRDPATLVRLRQRLFADSPEVVLLQEGINDINEDFFHDLSRLPQLVTTLRDMIREIRPRPVLLGTLLPEDPNGCRGSRGYDLVAPANEQIRAMAASENNVTAVDLYQAFGGAPGPYLNDDGLHPNPIGYQKMAETFFDSIKKTFEVPR